MPSSSTTTSTALLEGLSDPANAEAWPEFDRRYRPIIFGFARKIGLSEADAADVTQETLTAFLQAYRAGKYDRRRGRLGFWLMGIVRHRIADLKRVRVRRRELRGESAIVNLPGPEQLQADWQTERRASILGQALKELRKTTKTKENTIRAFELFVLKQRPAGQVAEELGLTVQDVYMAKNRVADRLRKILAQLELLYNDS